MKTRPIIIIKWWLRRLSCLCGALTFRHILHRHTHTHTPQVYFINFNIIIGLKHFPQSDKRTRIYIYTHEMRECLRWMHLCVCEWVKARATADCTHCCCLWSLLLNKRWMGGTTTRRETYLFLCNANVYISFAYIIVFYECGFHVFTAPN